MRKEAAKEANLNPKKKDKPRHLTVGRWAKVCIHTHTPVCSSMPSVAAAAAKK